MRAIVHRHYSGPEGLEVVELDQPVPSDEQVLVRVHAASLNALDWHELRGTPYLARVSMGLRHPKERRLGNDAAGVVEAVGAAVTTLRSGDRVFGSQNGSFADYVCGRSFVAMPPGLTFAEAAALPTAGLTALQAVRDHGAVRSGESVLVNGAGGGVGTYAVQIANAFGATVTAVTRPDSVDLVAGLGAQRVIDYHREDFTRGSERYDVIIDNGGNHRVTALRRVLTPGGRVVLVAPAAGNWLAPLARIVGATVRAKLLRQRVRVFLAKLTTAELRALAELVSSGAVRPVVDRTFPLPDTAAAIDYLERGGVRGKVVVEVVPGAAKPDESASTDHVSTAL